MGWPFCVLSAMPETVGGGGSGSGYQLEHARGDLKGQECGFEKTVLTMTVRWLSSEECWLHFR